MRKAFHIAVCVALAGLYGPAMSAFVLAPDTADTPACDCCAETAGRAEEGCCCGPNDEAKPTTTDTCQCSLQDAEDRIPVNATAPQDGELRVRPRLDSSLAHAQPAPQAPVDGSHDPPFLSLGAHLAAGSTPGYVLLGSFLL
jgi:hypothetical protein